MKKLYSIPKALGITAGLNILLLGLLLLFTHMVHKESGQTLLFLSLTLLLTLGLCLFAVIPASKRSVLWGCFGVSAGVHTLLSIANALVTGKKLTVAWPGDGDLSWILILLMSLSVWFIGIFWITVIRTARIGHARRESKRQVKRALKGYSKEYTPLSPARSRFVAILRGVLWVLWFHILTIHLLEWLTSEGLEETMLSYIAFPVLWSLMAAAYGLFHRQNPIALTLSATVSNLLLFLLPTTLLTVANSPNIKYRFVIHLDSVLTKPFDNPDQLLVIGVFLTVWVAMVAFGVGRRRETEK